MIVQGGALESEVGGIESSVLDEWGVGEDSATKVE